MKSDTGDKVEFINTGNGKFEMIAVTLEVVSLKGLFKSENVLSIEEMNRAIETSASK